MHRSGLICFTDSLPELVVNESRNYKTQTSSMPCCVHKQLWRARLGHHVDISFFLQKEPQRLRPKEHQDKQGKPPKPPKPWHQTCCPAHLCLSRSRQRTLLVKLQKGCLQLLGGDMQGLLCPHGVLASSHPKWGRGQLIQPTYAPLWPCNEWGRGLNKATYYRMLQPAGFLRI